MDIQDQQGFIGGNQSNTVMALEFKGSGSEYFRIWIVNLLLSIITLGIYSAWAKVRRNRYLYSSTSLAGSSFEYHGNPIAILKGRIVALVLFAAYNLAFKFSLAMGGVMLLVLMALMPWLIWKSLQFKLYNSSFRGIRFGFRGSAKQAYITFLLWPILYACSLGLLAPAWHQRIKQFQHSESRFGGTHFSFDGRVSQFYMAYLWGIGIMIVGTIVICVAFAGTLGATIFAARSENIAVAGTMVSLALFALAIYAWMFSVYPIFLTLLQNLIWNHTKLGNNQVSSHMDWKKMTSIALTNIVGIIFTLGLFIPFAQIRALRYRIESLHIEVADSLDHFVAATQEQVNATGEGAADLLDFDLSL
ncbi:YjgN family protein [Undibacterium sp. TS12]|uniref:YjgN family protein n=1 Tax=Undibacterium sp. TS12 TaxID=2908202 RepID=UPI001F4D3191|nr:YjgN family protein [Undibacterium sp. TS12]MCH8622842.1 DUF898 domain-containing protein [Undibacterium sp. TS12]